MEFAKGQIEQKNEVVVRKNDGRRQGKKNMSSMEARALTGIHTMYIVCMGLVDRGSGSWRA